MSAPLVSLRTAEASAKHCLLPTEGSAPLVSLRTAEASAKHCLLPTEASASFWLVSWIKLRYMQETPKDLSVSAFTGRMPLSE